MRRYWFLVILVIVFYATACQPQAPLSVLSAPEAISADETPLPGIPNSPQEPVPAYPTRPLFSPGELVDYTAQTGDTLPALAARFNTSIQEILNANPFIPESATTMPPGMPMKIPIYYLPLWGSPYQIIPDGLFVNGPGQVGFESQLFVEGYPGWLNGYVEYAAGANRSGADIVDYVALRYSVSPRLLLALLEYQAGALTQAEVGDDIRTYSLGNYSWERKGLYPQLNWAANLLNNGYYGYRAGKLLSIQRPDGRLERIDPWQNAATASLHNYFNQLYPDQTEYNRAISVDGLASTYQDLFGDPWQNDHAYIPGSLFQPELRLPFEPGNTWAYTGGPHNPWGNGEPMAALDFAPPDVTAGSCQPSSEVTTALADGLVVRSETGVVMLDLDGDGDERTGWNIFYLHVDKQRRAKAGTYLQVGDPVGFPSCEGGTSTGTHIHIARKYNGEWVLAEGPLAFNLEGWIAHNGDQAYQGTLTRNGQTVIACVCSNQKSFIHSEPR